MESRELAVRIANFYRDGHASREDVKYWEERLVDSNNDYLFNAMNSIASFSKASADIYGMESAYPLVNLGKQLQQYLNDKVTEQLRVCLDYDEDDRDLVRSQFESSTERAVLKKQLKSLNESGEIEPYIYQDLVRTLNGYGTAEAETIFASAVKDEDFLRKIADSAVEIAAKMQDGEKSIKFHNYTADIKKLGSQIGIAVSQLYDNVKETFAKASIDTEKKEAHIDFLKIPRALSAAAKSGREKIQALDKSWKDSISKTFGIVKEAITSKFPKDYDVDLSKIANLRADKSQGSKSTEFGLDTVKIMENIRGAEHSDMLSRSELVDFFERAQRSARSSGEKLNFHFAFGNGERVLDDVVKNGGVVQIFVADRTSKENQLQGNDEHGSLRIHVEDHRHGSFDSYVPLTEVESSLIVDKISEKVQVLEAQESKQAYEQLSGFDRKIVAEDLIKKLDDAGYTFVRQPSDDSGAVSYKVTNGDMNAIVQDVSGVAQFALENNPELFSDNLTIQLLAQATPEKVEAYCPIASITEPIINHDAARNEIVQACADMLEQQGYFITETSVGFNLNKFAENGELMERGKVNPNILAAELKTLPDIMTAMAQDMGYDSVDSLAKGMRMAVVADHTVSISSEVSSQIDALEKIASEIDARETYGIDTADKTMTYFSGRNPHTTDAIRDAMNTEQNTADVKDQQHKVFEGRA